LGLTLDTTQLANAVVGQTGAVLVAWEHKAIARALLPAIANGQSLPDMPTKWDGTRFDVVLRFDRGDSANQNGLTTLSTKWPTEA
jgi:hypothetical protein